MVDLKQIMAGLNDRRAALEEDVLRRRHDDSSLPPIPLLIVDATQSLGAVPFDVQDPVLAPALALVACSAHKWLNGAFGMSMVFVADAFWAPPLPSARREGLGFDKGEPPRLWVPLDQHDRTRLGATEPDWGTHVLMPFVMSMLLALSIPSSVPFCLAFREVD